MMEINRRLDAPTEMFQTQSPSSISDVDQSEQLSVKRRKMSDGRECHVESETCAEKEVVDANTTSEEASVTGDNALLLSDGRRDLVDDAPLGDINGDVPPAITTSSTNSRKRKLSDVSDHTGEAIATSPKDSSNLESVDPRSHADSGSESTGGTMDRASNCADDGDYDEIRSPPLDCSDAYFKRHSRRTLYIEYWSRTDECKERKWDHLDEIAEKYGGPEEHIFATTLNGRTACLEPNMFPYDTPAGIEHWTLWHVNELNHEQIKQYVENWIDANAPHIEAWNYDDNPERSIDIFHVHVYFQVSDGSSVLQGRQVEDLVHELD